MCRKETALEQMERLGREQIEQLKLRGQEFIKARLGWDDWRGLLPRLTAFAEREIGRRRWRGRLAGVLPQGHDANSIAAEAVAAALQGKLRLAAGWTFERVERELQRLVSNEVRRLHKLKEAQLVRSEWEVLGPDGENEPRSVLAEIQSTGSSGALVEEADARAKEKQNAEARIAERLGEDDLLAKQLFACLREGVVKRRAIAARLGIGVDAVTNCRKRLNRKLEELMRTGAGVPRGVLEDLRRRR
jgi:hypothetical protein